MKTRLNKKNIEEFIDYKIDHGYQSQSMGRAFVLQKKYQRTLDQMMGALVAKKNYIQSLQMELKSAKSEGWKKNLEITNLIQVYQRSKYQFVNKMRILGESKVERSKQNQQRKRDIEQKEKELISQIESIGEQSLEYFEFKLENIDNIKKECIQLTEEIVHHEPFVQKYYDCLIKRQSLLETIDKSRKDNQSQVKKLWSFTEQLSSLQQEKKNKISEKEKKHILQTQQRKQSINKFIEQIHQVLFLNFYEQQNAEIFEQFLKRLQTKKLTFQIENEESLSEKQFTKSQNFTKIIQIMGINSSFASIPISKAKISNIYSEPIRRIDEKIERQIENRKIELFQQKEIIERREGEIKKKQRDLRNIEDLKNKEITSLNQTLNRMKKSLE